MKKFYYRDLLEKAISVYNFLVVCDATKKESSFMSADGLYFEADMGYLIDGLKSLVDALIKKIGD